MQKGSKNAKSDTSQKCKTSPSRAKNGQFSSKSPQGQPANKTKHNKDTAFILRISEETTDAGATSKPFPRMPLFSSFQRLCQVDHNKGEDLLEKFFHHIVQENPDSFVINDRTYYSQQAVNKIKTDVIEACAKAATDEMCKAAKESHVLDKSINAEEEKDKDARLLRLAEKLSKWVANILVAIFLIGVGSASIYGICHLVKILAR